MMKKSLMITWGILVILLAGAFFVFGSTSPSNKTEVAPMGAAQTAATTKVITLSASRFQYDPGTITVKKGDHVKILINNKDTIHGIIIPDFGVSGIESVEFIADKAGTFDFHCPTMCGPGHKEMKGTLIVEDS